MREVEDMVSRMTDGEVSSELREDFKKLEDMVFNNPEMMDVAEKEEIQSYRVIDELEEDDFRQMLKNIAEITKRTKGMSEEEERTMLSMDRMFLKLLIIDRWTRRTEKKKE